MELKPGQLWQHYKGGKYRIVLLAKNNQTDELYDVVVYVDATDSEKVWTQSLERFLSTEQYEGNTVPRFTLISEE